MFSGSRDRKTVVAKLLIVYKQDSSIANIEFLQPLKFQNFCKSQNFNLQEVLFQTQSDTQVATETKSKGWRTMKTDPIAQKRKLSDNQNFWECAEQQTTKKAC